MTRQTTTARSPIALKNVAAFSIMTQRLLGRGAMQPGFAVFYGFSGYGKSLASIFTQNKTGAIRVELGDSWTRRTLLLNILRELGLEPQRKQATIPDMAAQVITALADAPERPLIIDEADYAVDKGFLGLIRELQEHSGAPVILIGEEKLPSKLLPVERLHNRVLDWTAAQPCDLDDTRALIEAYAPGITFATDLIEAIRTYSDGRARRIVSNIHRAIEIAGNKAVKKLALSDWGDAPWHTGDPPLPRSVAPYVRAKVAA